MYPERMLRFPAFVAALLWCAAALAQTEGGASPSGHGLCQQVPAIAEDLTQISGMRMRHPVPCDFITKEKTKPEEIRAEELTLKKFGLLPPDFDLAKTTVDLLTEQAAAFYDYDRKKLFITETTSTDPQEPVLAHELAHAIADQTFNLGKF